MVKVAVTGGTGYLASWCVHMLLEEKYEVVTTVRDPDSSKCKFLHDWKKEGKKLEIKKADLLDTEDVWIPILTGCDFVLHVASPFPLVAPKNDDELVKPAVSGSEIVLRCAGQALQLAILHQNEQEKSCESLKGIDASFVVFGVLSCASVCLCSEGQGQAGRVDILRGLRLRACGQQDVYSR